MQSQSHLLDPELVYLPPGSQPKHPSSESTVPQKVSKPDSFEDHDIMMDTSLPRNFSQSQPTFQLRFVGQHTEASHCAKCGAVTAATTFCCMFSHQAQGHRAKLHQLLQSCPSLCAPRHCLCAQDISLLIRLIQQQITAAKHSISAHNLREHFLDNCYCFIHLVTNFHCVCQVSEAS